MSFHASLSRALLVVALVSSGAHAQGDPLERKGFTGAFGVGLTSAGTSCVPECTTERQNGISMLARVGAHLAPEFTLGIEGTFFRTTVKDVSPAGRWSMTWVTVTTLWYPSSDDDFFLKLGLGVAVVRVDVPFPSVGSLSLNSSDFGASFGIGKDYRFTDRLALTAFANMMFTPRSQAVVNGSNSGAKLGSDLIQLGLAVTIP
jgi:hypothetical protein